MKNIINKRLDNLLVYAPWWFPLVFIFLLINYPSLNKFILIGSLFIFAETHFASTWTILINKKNFAWIKKNFYEFFVLPIFVAFLLILIWPFSPEAILITHYLASGWHVTRQSIGISKLSNNGSISNNLIIYVFSFTCLIVGLIEPGILSKIISREYLNMIIILFSFFYFLLMNKSSNNRLSNFINKNFSLITGSFIYLPLLFINNVAIALAIGVGMHWIQYLTIVFTINIRRLKASNHNSQQSKKRLFNKQIFNGLIFIFFYSLIMTFFTLKGIPKDNENEKYISIFYLIPIIFQMYHFYIDGYIWKFSDKHIKDNILPFLFKKNSEKNLI